MAEYHSCPHVAAVAAQRAIDTIARNQRTGLPVSQTCSVIATYSCITCDAIGILNDAAFRNHAFEQGHHVCLRNREPNELYCFICNDFQFSSVYDNYNKRKRPALKFRSSNGGSGELWSGGLALKKVKGMYNMGATCFMSSVLQIIMKNPVAMRCRQLRLSVENCRASAMRSMSIDNSMRSSDAGSVASQPALAVSCMYCEFKKLCLEAAREDGLSVLTPSNLLYATWQESSSIAGYHQQDAHEFLIAFLDGVDKHARQYHSMEAPTPESTRGTKPLDKASKSIEVNELVHVFRGSLESHLTCTACGDSRVRGESFLDLSLSLNKSGRNSLSGQTLCSTPPLVSGLSAGTSPLFPENGEADKPELTLYDCLRSFTALETLGERVFCERCGDNKQTQKQLFVATPPNVLVLHLKRFDMLTKKKVKVKVNVQLSLDIADFLCASTDADADTKKCPRDTSYFLQGMVSHSGSLHAGHYVSYVANFPTPECLIDLSKRQWLKCDDDKVAAVTEEDVLGAEAYVLFYVNRRFAA
ncbi:hypothetical protein B484DRAFT_483048 [Ochromonadaceae sp. CCMP2298]|nr:hypothetical protein B484DRAFT_483048 [Ochromonadaceae sp. CCMP2298]